MPITVTFLISTWVIIHFLHATLPLIFFAGFTDSISIYKYLLATIIFAGSLIISVMQFFPTRSYGMLKGAVIPDGRPSRAQEKTISLD